MTALKLSPQLELPVDAVTGTFGILATKGAGKSNAAVVMAEEMWDAGVPWVAVDPKGDWWGIRSRGDGKGPGLPIVVFGGRHGDVPLEPTAGALLADLVLGQRLSCVLDVSQFTKADTIRFLTAFGDRLFRHADDDDVAEPLHLFLEEAHEYLPQQVTGPVANMVATWQRIVKQGRFKGLGCTLISQRSSSLNKDVLELIDTLVVLRTIGPRSRDAVKQWVRDQDVDETLLASLPSLASGEAWVWSPGELQLMQRIRFRRRRTFDSGATPKVGQARKAPATLADVDLAAIKEQMADTIEKAKADDPKELQRRIKDLERELAARPEVEPQQIEVPYVPDVVVDLIEELGQALQPLEGIERRIRNAATTLGVRPVPAQEAPAPRAPARQVRSEAFVTTMPTPPEVDFNLSPYAQRLLEAIAKRHPVPLTERQWSVAADRSTTSSGWAPAVRQLTYAGLVAEHGGDFAVTDAGLEVAGVDPGTPPPTGPELIDWWCQRIPGSAQTALRTLAAIDQGDGVSIDELADAAGWSRTSSGPGAAVAVLVKLGLASRSGRLVHLDEDLR
jgi:hypothetical protein